MRQIQGSNAVIRPATISDALRLSRLNMAVQELHARAQPDFYKPPEGPDFAVSFYAHMLADPEVYIYIIEDPQPVGYIVTHVMRRPDTPFTYPQAYLHIDQISVEPEFQGKGYGALLMGRARQLARELGLSQLTLNTWYFNGAAQAFFTDQGFVTYNLRMWLHLPP